MIFSFTLLIDGKRLIGRYLEELEFKEHCASNELTKISAFLGRCSGECHLRRGVCNFLLRLSGNGGVGFGASAVLCDEVLFQQRRRRTEPGQSFPVNYLRSSRTLERSLVFWCLHKRWRRGAVH